MPRAMHTPTRLYTTEIMALQRLLRLTDVDARIAKDDKRKISIHVSALTMMLNNAHVARVENVDNDT